MILNYNHLFQFLIASLMPKCIFNRLCMRQLEGLVSKNRKYVASQHEFDDFDLILNAD
jgi:hypothetical protein